MELRLTVQGEWKKRCSVEKKDPVEKRFSYPAETMVHGFCVGRLEHWVMGLLFMGPHIRDSGGTAHDLVHVKEERGREEESIVRQQ